jgi:hypothetical protein
MDDIVEAINIQPMANGVQDPDGKFPSQQLLKQLRHAGFPVGRIGKHVF